MCKVVDIHFLANERSRDIVDVDHDELSACCLSDLAVVVVVVVVAVIATGRIASGGGLALSFIRLMNVPAICLINLCRMRKHSVQ